MTAEKPLFFMPPDAEIKPQKPLPEFRITGMWGFERIIFDMQKIVRESMNSSRRVIPQNVDTTPDLRETR